jgi:hypothetical protein
MSLTRQYDVSAWIDKVGQLGTFDTLTGGGVDSDEVKYHPGGMGETITLGGISEIDNVVLGRIYLLERDHQQYVAASLFQVGKVGMVIVKQPLDGEGNAWGRPIVYIGTFKRCTPPEHDSTATDAGIIEYEMTPAFVGLG